MQIRKISAELLSPAEYNPRKDLTPEDAEWKSIEFSLTEYGLVVPIVFNERTGRIVSGHQRAKILVAQGVKEIECSVVDLDENKEKELNLALNKISGAWDNEKLEMLVAELEPATMEMLGFDDIIDATRQVSEDDYEIEPPAEPKAKQGDMWQLGNHRLICGDITQEHYLKMLMGGEETRLLVTDPPYNVDYVGKTKDALKIQNDKMADDTFYTFLEKAFKNIHNALKEGGAFYIFHADSEGENFRRAVRENLGKVRQCLVWNKNVFVMGRQDYHWKHEPILYGWKDGDAHYFVDDRTQATVFDEKKIDIAKLKRDEAIALLKRILGEQSNATVIDDDKPTASESHPTMKPIRLVGKLIKNSTRAGEIVLDTFSGSGSVLIACEQLGRKCYAMEIDPKYCDVIIDRWEKLTNQKARMI